jgi:hypothetical protein
VLVEGDAHEAIAMDQPWCCLTCFARFRFGELVGTGRGRMGGLGCPTCKGDNISPADGATVYLDRSFRDGSTIQ